MFHQILNQVEDGKKEYCCSEHFVPNDYRICLAGGRAKVQVTGYRPQVRSPVTGQVTDHRSQATDQVTGHKKQ